MEALQQNSKNELQDRLFSFVVDVIRLIRNLRESNYWIRLVIAITEKNDEWKKIRQESHELMNISGSIYSKTSVQR